MTYSPIKTLTAEEFIETYGDDPRYELIDGKLRDLDPTGPHESVAGKAAGYLFAEALKLGADWVVPKNCLICPLAAGVTVLRPDAILLDNAALGKEPLWEREPVITSGQAVKLVVEVVSSNWQDDYARKTEEYALLGIPEYWIVDFRGLGGVGYIGRPKQPTFTICTLQGNDYLQQQYRLGEAIQSKLFPELQLRLDALMP